MADDATVARWLPAVPARPPLRGFGCGAYRRMETLTISEEEVGQRLDVLLAQRFPAYSRARWQQLIDSGGAHVNAVACKSSLRLKLGDVVSVSLPEEKREAPEPQDIPLEILHDDEHLVVVYKPHGMVVHPAKGHWNGTLTAALAFHFEQLSSVGGPTRPGIVHRLDRDTSGVMVVAKTDAAHVQLTRQFEERTVEKEYFALVRGRLDRDRDTIDQPIGPHPYQREKMSIRAGHPASRSAVTFYEVQGRYGAFTHLKVLPKTGRTHQIRVHLSHLGCPVVCDPLYAGYRQLTEGELDDAQVRGPVVLGRLALHARRLAFTHPATGVRMEFEATLPEELTRFLALLAARPRRR
jgi:23S rRNA pseudouridine1911/1915/1917 synthase